MAHHGPMVLHLAFLQSIEACHELGLMAIPADPKQLLEKVSHPLKQHPKSSELGSSWTTIFTRLTFATVSMIGPTA